MPAASVWHGTADELDQLTKAVTDNCVCGQRSYLLAPRCPAHQLLDDQRALDRLLFARRIAARLRQEEFADVPVGV